jgi:hypothetical protein
MAGRVERRKDFEIMSKPSNGKTKRQLRVQRVVRPRLQIVIDRIPEQTIEAFGVAHNLVMEVKERSREVNAPDRFYAYFKSVEVSEGAFLRSTFGNGQTPEQAITNYAPEISMKRIVVDAMKTTRREINVPRLVA